MRLDIKKNTIMGALSGIANKVIVTVLPFIMRTVIIYALGTQYLGLSSLFTSILSVLSLAELGFGGALVYSMYKPIAENDTNMICALLGLYKKIYRIIGTVILIGGTLLTPFLPRFINGNIPDDINVYVLYLVYLSNTVISYFLFAYKNSLLIAFQRNDISNNINSILTILEYVLQIILVLVFKNYYCYAVLSPTFTVLGNIVRAIIVDKKYPQYVCKGLISAEIKSEIYKKTLALASHKIGNTISTSLDSLVVSAFLGLSSVAIFGNYNYIVTTVMSLIGIVYSSMTAGIGNKMNLQPKESSYRDFMALSILNNVVICWACGCMLFLYQPFIELWTGSENMLPMSSVIIFVLYFYIYQSRKVVLMYKDAAGLWKEDQIKPLIGAGVNLFFNILLVKYIGINGVIISSIISFILIEIPWEIVVLHKYFGIEVKYYINQTIKAFLICLPIWGITGLVCGLVHTSHILAFIIKILICGFISIPYLFLIYRHNTEFIRMVSKILPVRVKIMLKI